MDGSRAPFEHELPEDERRALRRVHDALRALIDDSVRLGGSADALSSLARELEATAARMRALATGKPMQRYAPVGDDPSGVLPYSPISGPYNPLAPPVRLSVEERDGRRVLLGDVTLGEPYEGPPGCAHGAVVAGIYDQHLAVANMLGDTAGFTGSLTVSFRRPTPLYVPLRFTAWTERVDGRKVVARGTCHHGDELLTEAEGLFVQYRRPAQ